MVVDHVENDAHPERVGAVDERAQVVGLAVEVRGRIEVDAVVAPAEAAGELGHRHHLDERDAGVAQLFELAHGARKGAFPRERSDVHLVHDLTA